MPFRPRKRPSRLGKKLVTIRKAFRLSQDQIIVRLGFQEELVRAQISQFERGVREPPLPLLLAYAHLANVYLDALADDDLDLPNNLPASPKSSGIPRPPKGKLQRRIHS